MTRCEDCGKPIDTWNEFHATRKVGPGKKQYFCARCTMANHTRIEVTVRQGPAKAIQGRERGRLGMKRAMGGEAE